MKIIRTISILALAFCLSGCLSTYYLVTYPYERIKRSKPDLYYSFSITISYEGTSRIFQKSVLCKHYIGFGSNGWRDFYAPNATEIVFEDQASGTSWQLHGVDCPDERVEMFGVFRRNPDGRIGYLSWHRNSDAFTNEWEFERRPKYEVATASTRLYRDDQFPLRERTYTVAKLKDVPEVLSGVQQISVLSKTGHNYCKTSSPIVVTGGSDIKWPEYIEYYHQGVLEYRESSKEWVLGERRAADGFVDVEIITLPDKHSSTAIRCRGINYKGFHIVEQDFEELYDPEEGIIISISNDFDRVLGQQQFVECGSQVPQSIYEIMEKYPDYHAVPVSWDEESKQYRQGALFPYRNLRSYIRVGGKLMCLR